MIFLILMVVMVFPLVTLEVFIGQFFRKPLVKIFAGYSKKWVGVLITGTLGGFVLCSFYMYLMAYMVLYVYYTLTGQVTFFNLPEKELLAGTKQFFVSKILQSDYDPLTTVD